MHFFIAVIDQATGTADADEMAAIDAFNDQLRIGGHWVMAAGLAAPSQAVVIDNRTGSPVTTQGPFVETSEHVAGFWVITADDHTQAVELASAGSRACQRKVEVRPFL